MHQSQAASLGSSASWLSERSAGCIVYRCSPSWLPVRRHCGPSWLPVRRHLQSQLAARTAALQPRLAAREHALQSQRAARTAASQPQLAARQDASQSPLQRLNATNAWHQAAACPVLQEWNISRKELRVGSCTRTESCWSPCVLHLIYAINVHYIVAINCLDDCLPTCTGSRHLNISICMCCLRLGLLLSNCVQLWAQPRSSGHHCAGARQLSAADTG